MKRPLDTIGAFRVARHRARLAFLILITFLVAQVIWWVVFQRNYIDQYVQHTAEAWATQAEFASAAQGSIALPAHLMRQGSLVIVRREALEVFKQRQERYVRMFAFEVPFFLIIMFLGLWVIWGSMQSDLELRRRQENFLMAASHEFRTPISSLKLLLETLQIRVLERDKQLELVQRATLEVQRLQATTERVLATARLEHKQQPRLEVQDLIILTQKIIETQRSALETRGANLEFHFLTKNLPVLIDGAALEIVLTNLLDNAIKYTPAPMKPIVITMDCFNNQARLSLEDRGVGINADEKKFVFDQFYRVGSELTRVTKGLGLGLYLVKALTERMNGKVKLESLPVGTRFTLLFPLREAA
jgi:signal transduction histidine kinase